MKITVHTKGISGSEVIKPGEEADAMFAGVLEVDGHVLDRVSEIDVSSGDKFTTVTVVFVPGEVEHSVHSNDSWVKLIQKADEQRESYRYVRDGKGFTIARTSE